jgi:protein AbiQ
MEIIFLNKEFYIDYADCKEIEKKENRPHFMILATIEKIDFAIPLRSHIKHTYVVWTNKENQCGLDLSKSIVIVDKNKYIDTSIKPYIREDEFRKLRGKDYFIKQKLETYIKQYKKALKKQELRNNNLMCKFSTLQYFHKELGIF